MRLAVSISWRALQASVISACLIGLGGLGYGLHDLFTISDEERLTHHLNLVPEGLSVTERVYWNTNFAGFGPSSNEAGIILYQLPEVIIPTLKVDGVSNLAKATIDPDVPPSLRLAWRETPLDTNSLRWNCGGSSRSPCSGIVEFATRYWYLDRPVPDDLIALVDNALRTPGNFYAFYRNGLIVILPDAERVVFAFN